MVLGIRGDAAKDNILEQEVSNEQPSQEENAPIARKWIR